MALVADSKPAPVAGNFYFSPVKFEAAALTDIGEHPGFAKVPEPNLSLVKRKVSDDVENENEDEDSDDEEEEVVKKTVVKKKSRNKIKKKLGFFVRCKEWFCEKFSFTWFMVLLILLIASIILCFFIFWHGPLMLAIRFCCYCCAPLVPFLKKKSKKKDKDERKNLLNVEDGLGPYQSRTSKKKRKGGRMVDTATQDSRPNLTKKKKKRGIGCSPCCRKKSRK